MSHNKLISLRINDSLHENATAVLGGMGLTVSDATRIFLSYIVKHKSLPSQIFNQDVYDEWFREKVREAMEDTRPTIPHEQVVARFSRIINET